MTRGGAGLDQVLAEVRACRICDAHLPLGPRPVLRARRSARLLIIGQAPGTRVHETGIPWNDPSGDRLRDWMQIDRDRFYDDRNVAIVPMGFCYPGVNKAGGDAPPRPECAPAWHAAVLAHLPSVDLTLLVGGYAQKYYLRDHVPGNKVGSVADTVAAWAALGPRFLPLPHPSWRTRAWVKRNPWFETEVLPHLRARVAALIG